MRIKGIQRHLQANKIGEEEAMMIAEALKINETLTALDLGVKFFYFEQIISNGRKFIIHRPVKLNVKEQLKLPKH